MMRTVLVNLLSSVIIVALFVLLLHYWGHAPLWAKVGFGGLMFFMAQNAEAWKGRP